MPGPVPPITIAVAERRAITVEPLPGFLNSPVEVQLLGVIRGDKGDKGDKGDPGTPEWQKTDW